MGCGVLLDWLVVCQQCQKNLQVTRQLWDSKFPTARCHTRWRRWRAVESSTRPAARPSGAAESIAQPAVTSAAPALTGPVESWPGRPEDKNYFCCKCQPKLDPNVLLLAWVGFEVEPKHFVLFKTWYWEPSPVRRRSVAVWTWTFWTKKT